MPSKPAKTPTKKTARKSGQSTVKAAPKKMTIAALAADLKSLESRLKGADTKNRNAVKALQGVVEDIKASAKQSTTTQKAALTRGLNQLEIRMETYLDRAAAEARAGVRAELANVTASGADLAVLENALQAAHGRLDALDETQRNALGRLNRHIADLATSVERRLNNETKARQAESTQLQAKISQVQDRLETRIDQVEQETADALQSVGAKISEFAAALEDRAKTSDVDTAERLADLAQETQSEFSSVQTDVTARLEALEMIASNWTPAEPVAANPYLPANADDPRIDQMGETIQALQDELSRIHARMATVQDAASNVVSMPAKRPVVQDNPYAAAARALEMNAVETPAPQPVEPPAPTKTEFTAPVQNTSAKNSHIPQEFDPSAFNAPAPEPVPSPPVHTAPPAHMPPQAPPMASSGSYAPMETNLASGEPLMPAPLPVSTYADPAYAEGDDMRAERIGGAPSKRPSLPKIPLSGRNLRVGAMAVGVGVVGLLAAKMVLGGPETAPSQAQINAPNVAKAPPLTQAAELTQPNNPNDFTLEPSVSTPPLGEYAETQTPIVTAGAQDTLDAAVQAGNPIAQFQKGLVQLQAGQMEEGARLIRLAANRNQPAAQYRLAKLYESGTGIAKDPVTARELIDRAARGGNRIAMHDLGNYHAYGQGGLDRDMNKALDWFTKAAERGVVDSQFNVAFLREGNEGVPADIETALFWYHIAARQGDQGAPDRIGVLTEQLDPSTVAGIKARADRFNPKPVDEAANGIFRNVPWAKGPTKTAGAVSPAQSAQIIKIRDAQTMLSSLGYEVGTPDGIAGAKTRNAVKSFEAVNGLPETGQVTDDLIRKLEMASSS